MSKFKIKILRSVAVFLLLNFLLEFLAPVAAYALTSGPSQPEFSSFEPVATTNMVNEFSGGFTYNLPAINIPGPNGGGYAVSLSYHSGAKPEEEASWVGYGWTLNPGAINRSKVGFADDQKGTSITTYNKQPKNWTVSVGASLGVEFMSLDIPIGVNASAAVSYNNYRGFGIVKGAGLSVKDGLASLQYNGTDGEHSFSAAVNPAALRSGSKTQKKLKKVTSDLKNLKNPKDPMRNSLIAEGAVLSEKVKKEEKSQKRKTKLMNHLGDAVSQYGMHLIADEYRPSQVIPYVGFATNVSFNFKPTFSPLEIGFELGGTGSFSIQDNIDQKDHHAYGYMYQKEALSDMDRMMDYNIEKESIFSGRDKYLSIPTQAADMFGVTGEGIVGGFRLHRKEVGHFTPNYNTSFTPMANMQIELEAGFDNGGGFSVGAGLHTLSVGDWGGGNTGGYVYDGTGLDEPCFFRFNNDKGGNLLYTDSDAPSQARLKFAGGPVEPYVNADIKQNLSLRSGRASYIGYNTNAEMNHAILAPGTNGEGSFDLINYRAYTKDTSTRKINDRITGINDGIGEFVTVGEKGNKYIYGLPVYSSNEVSKAYGIQGIAVPNNNTVYTDISNDNNFTRIHGELNDNPVANTYLLTQINTPDYIDRSFNGPTYDDFGGWTKFNYKQLYGSMNKTSTGAWYNWRAPYNGLTYTKNQLSDPRDDMGAVSAGKKEIYYLKNIETKTHVAFFITNNSLNGDFGYTHAEALPFDLNGSGVQRSDGLEAADYQAGALANAKGTKKLERLERIVLYAKNSSGQLTGKPLKIVRFEYYADGDSKVLSKGLPNSSYSNAGKNGGKLTLKKIWFEYEGIVNSRISAYEFKYEYKKLTEYKAGGSDIQTKYTDVNNKIINYRNYTVQPDGSNPENPDYNELNIDGWGDYRYNGAQRYLDMRPWVSQKADDPLYDPAAWQLKQIKLPSGGEILVQYEQNDYSYVQDKKAMAMISLAAIDGTDPSPDLKIEGAVSNLPAQQYVLNLNDLNLPSPVSDLTGYNNAVDAYLPIIQDYLSKNKVHFKFLYRVFNNPTNPQDNVPPSLNDCDVDYISGYTNAIAGINLSGSKKVIYLQFTGSGYTFPKKVCFDHVRRNTGGENITKSCGSVTPNLTNESALDNVVSFFGAMENRLATFLAIETSACVTMSLSKSYFKIPLMADKKGGGVRVKRILMYDAGLEGDESLYGSEYSYKLKDGTSSGVATNEPSPMREENALVGFLQKRAPQTSLQKAISGQDKEEFEGPNGESLLPSPSIGYSRVIVRNIHKGKTNTGFSVNEFYTAKDFPMTSDFTDISKERSYIPIPAFVVNINIDNRWASQGYVFTLNEMHGQTKRVAAYRGDYQPGTDESTYYSTSEQIYEYYQPGEKVKVMDNYGITTDGYVGKEAEVSMEMKNVADIQNNISVQVDFSLGLAGPIPLPEGSACPYYSLVEKQLRTHVTTKVIRYAAVQKSVTTKHDGMVQVSKNLVFDSNTGEPVITQTTDEYDQLTLASTLHNGVYLNYSIPAAKIYREMGQKATGERFNIVNGNFTVYSQLLNPKPGWLGGGNNTEGHNCYITLGSPSYANPQFTSAQLTDVIRGKIIDAFQKGNLAVGDLIRMYEGSGVTLKQALFHIVEFDNFSQQRIYLQPLSMVINDKTSLPAYQTFQNLEVIRSGRTNQLHDMAASISTYGVDYATQPNVFNYATSGSPADNYIPGIISLNNLNNVVSASVQTYSDDWYHHLSATGYAANYDCNGPRVHETGTRGKWRPKSSFVYKESVTQASKNYNNGTFSTTDYFRFKGVEDPTNYTFPKGSSVGEYINAPDYQSKWQETKRVNAYSPNGNPIEEQNILGIRSAAAFAYSDNVPVIVAQNAAYSTLNFESFENNASIISSLYAHSGMKSYELKPASSYYSSKIVVDQQVEDNGMSVKFWLKTSDNAPANVNTALKITLFVPELSGVLGAGDNPYLGNLTYIARVGEWSLYEAKFTGVESYALTGMAAPYYTDNGNSTDISYAALNKDFATSGKQYLIGLQNLGASSFWIDDLRMQPCNAQVMTYVYDPKNLRLLTSFDDQHFGLYYQYNAEGQLVRKLIETERGIKTITETQYNVPLKARTP